MSRNVALRRATASLGRPWLGAVATVALATLAGLLLARLLMDPPARDLRDLALYLLLSGGATVGLGWLGFRSTDRAAGLSIRAKAFIGTVIGSAVALLNVLITAVLMFFSTAHDLPLLIALLLFSAIVTASFSLRVAAALTNEVGVVADGIVAIAGGSYDTRVAVEGRDEVAQLGRCVNELAERLEAAERQRAALDQERRDLTAAISHDLRTPLASVHAMVEALGDGVVEEPAEVARYYATMRREIERLDRMIADLFELAQIDAGALRLSRGPAALQEVAAEVVDAMEAQARAAGVALALTVDQPPPELTLDGARIERALTNLVRNAIEHTPSGGSVAVSVGVRDGAATVRVSDTGAGIEPGDLPHIWDRFYRAERSRRRGPRSDDGAGLGLAIVRGVVEAHGGRAEVASTPGRGATFTLRLPLDRHR